MAATNPTSDTIVELIVGSLADGLRIDLWLSEQLPDLSRSQLKKILQAGRVTVDGAIPKPSTTIR